MYDVPSAAKPLDCIITLLPAKTLGTEFIICHTERSQHSLISSHNLSNSFYPQSQFALQSYLVECQQ